ncbi:hypothetical protein CHS0354_037755 [Potamilus streckersoni]|uniref:Kazal-like domain-containing protein n=1 Tax=Potamilus streckersoni TaxID=2493646 RepID=A0AAE0T4D3_9BIVA|nr:hypothetical protein CHS0354_037755 [Potamilus streckersoni]
MNCTGSCGCNDEKYFPICGSDGRSYYSPCHAGCDVKPSVMTFSNCSCIERGTATAGLCDQSCTMLYPWAATNFVGSIVLALQIIPTFIAKIRCVEATDRSVSVALSGFATSTLGWMPGPVILGAIIDRSCIVWKYICGEQQSCLLNDIVHFRNSMFTFGSITRTLVILIFVVVIWLVKDLKALKFEEDKNKEDHANEIKININEEEKAMLQEDVKLVNKSAK